MTLWANFQIPRRARGKRQTASRSYRISRQKKKGSKMHTILPDIRSNKLNDFDQKWSMNETKVDHFLVEILFLTQIGHFSTKLYHRLSKVDYFSAGIDQFHNMKIDSISTNIDHNQLLSCENLPLFDQNWPFSRKIHPFTTTQLFFDWKWPLLGQH